MNSGNDSGNKFPPGLGIENEVKDKLFAKFSTIRSSNQQEQISRLSWPNTSYSVVSTTCSTIKEEEARQNKVEEIMNAILEIGLNCIGLLNEVSSKVKKRVDYIVKNSPLNNVKLFECECVYDKVPIGTGKGGSKQAARNEAALKAVRYLMEKKDLEEAYITLSVQKMKGIGPVLVQPINASTPDKTAEALDSTLMNGSALYELNQIAKELFIEPKWKISSAGGPNGQFETELVFDKLTAIGKGRKKDDAKRDAAMQIIQKIRSSKELSEKYNPKARKGSSNQNSMTEVVRQDRARNFFTSCLSQKFADTQADSLRWMDSITEPNRNFDDYLSDLVLQYKLDDNMQDLLQGFFKVISDHTEIITSNPKQVLLDAPKHLADYATNCYLVPTGSFALDCMRRDKLTINAVLVYEESKEIAEKEFLNLYQYSLQEYQKLLQAESQLTFKVDIEIVSSAIGEYLMVSAKSVEGKLTMQIQLYNATQNGVAGDCDPSILHIKRVYDCFEDSHKLQQYRDAMGLMRLWREKNKLMLVPPEIIDAVLLDSFLHNKANNTAGHIMNCLTIMNVDENLKPLLAKYGGYYINLYKDVNSRTKLVISNKCTESLEAIYSQKLKDTGFY